MKEQIIADIADAFHTVKSNGAFIHIIPNNVTSGICADTAAALLCHSVMSDSPDESPDITERSDSLMVSLGQPNREKLDAVFSSLDAANSSAIPVIFDPDGAGFSNFRKEAVKEIISKPWHGIIKGNMMEMQSILTGKLEDKFSESRSRLVDFSSIKNLNRHLLCGEDPVYKTPAKKPDVKQTTVEDTSPDPGTKKQFPVTRSDGTLVKTGGPLSVTGTPGPFTGIGQYVPDSRKIFAVTGERDYVISLDKYAVLSHKADDYYKLAGSGCMASVLCALFLTCTEPFTAAVAGLATLSFASFTALKNSTGYGDYKTRLFNVLSNLTESELRSYLADTLKIK